MYSTSSNISALLKRLQAEYASETQKMLLSNIAFDTISYKTSFCSGVDDRAYPGSTTCSYADTTIYLEIM